MSGLSIKAKRELERACQSRRVALLKLADAAGLLGPKDQIISAHVPGELLKRAMQRSGTKNMEELLTYALAKVALEDDFGMRLVARRGRVPRDTLTA